MSQTPAPHTYFHSTFPVDLLHGRTLHLHALTPFYPPLLEDGDYGTLGDNGILGDHQSLSQRHLDDVAQQLHTFLRVRLSGSLPPLAGDTPSSRSDPRSAHVLKNVRTAFVQMPGPSNNNVPAPWAIEIELQQTEPDDAPLPRKQRIRTEKAHLVFFSTPTRRSPFHYPLVIWKAPTAHILHERQQPAPLSAQDNTPFSPRALMTHALDFVMRYFDCRTSPLGPLSLLRGHALKGLAEAVLRNVRLAGDNVWSQDAEHSIDVSYALPVTVAQGEQHEPKPKRPRTCPGPAPDLNSVTLSVPFAVVEELLRGTRPDTPLFPAIEQYLTHHTSLQLDRLTLVRLGIAGIYVGAPSSSTLATSSLVSGEVRLKFLASKSDRDPQVISRRIANVLDYILEHAQTDMW